MFNSTGVLSEPMSGFRLQRWTADSLADLGLSLEEARTTRQTAPVVFHDIDRAFIALPRKINIERLQSSGPCGCIFQYLSTFLSGRTISVNIRGCINTNLNVTQGVPYEIALSPWLFNITLAYFPGYCLQPLNVTVHIALYADDLALLCVGSTTRGSAARNALQQGIHWTILYLHKLGLTLSPTETAPLCCFASRRLSLTPNTIFLNRQPIRRMRPTHILVLW